MTKKTKTGRGDEARRSLRQWRLLGGGYREIVPWWIMDLTPRLVAMGLAWPVLEGATGGSGRAAGRWGYPYSS